MKLLEICKTVQNKRIIRISAYGVMEVARDMRKYIPVLALFFPITLYPVMSPHTVENSLPLGYQTFQR